MDCMIRWLWTSCQMDNVILKSKFKWYSESGFRENRQHNQSTVSLLGRFRCSWERGNFHRKSVLVLCSCRKKYAYMRPDYRGRNCKFASLSKTDRASSLAISAIFLHWKNRNVLLIQGNCMPKGHYLIFLRLQVCCSPICGSLRTFDRIKKS